MARMAAAIREHRPGESWYEIRVGTVHPFVIASFCGLALGSAGLVACSYPQLPALPAGAPDASSTASSDAGDSLAAREAFHVTPNRKLDLLFMIDDSPSMADKQTNLAANFPHLLDVLNQLPGGLPSLHIGVVTSDLGSKGADDPTAGPSIGTLGAGGCAGLGRAGALKLSNGATTSSGEPFLTDIAAADGTRTRNYTGALADVFAQIAQVGAGGCGFEQSLEAVKQALERPTPRTPGSCATTPRWRW
jgi:hypothetical protein